jgi:hypothetical protein
VGIENVLCDFLSTSLLFKFCYKQFNPLLILQIRLFASEVFLFCLLIALIVALLRRHLTFTQLLLVQEGVSVAFYNVT